MPPPFAAFLAVHILGEMFGEPAEATDREMDISGSLGSTFFSQNSCAESWSAGRSRANGRTMKPTAIDLFCGAGGLSLGLQSAGFNVVGAFDSWEPAARSYRLNFRHHPCFLEDVAALTSERLGRLGLPKEVDLVAGGPPCQGFSIQRIGADEDVRNDLVFGVCPRGGSCAFKGFPYGECYRPSRCAWTRGLKSF